MGSDRSNDDPRALRVPGVSPPCGGELAVFFDPSAPPARAALAAGATCALRSDGHVQRKSWTESAKAGPAQFITTNTVMQAG
jgi:hypothetical protein